MDNITSTSRKREQVGYSKLSAEDGPSKAKSAKLGEPNLVSRHSSVASDKEKDKKGVCELRCETLSSKYNPTNIEKVIGQRNDNSCAKRLHTWLANWYVPSDGNDKKYRAALISGPPGIGKTSTAHLVCATLGKEVLEFNASDTRSKKHLKEKIFSLINNKTIKLILNQTETKSKDTPNHVLLMDEVDGMAGNEDRGGMQELLSIIKKTKIPIICICNDRYNSKIKSLSSYALDLKFQKPSIEQIKGGMMSLCFKEGIKIKSDELTPIIESTNQDVRQVLHHLEMATANFKSGINGKLIHKNEGKCKDLKLGPWDAVNKVFSAEKHKNMSIHDKSDLFFHDYNIISLFIQENYLNVVPSDSKNKLLDKIAECSDSIVIGDLIETSIRSNQAWNLLPLQACFSSVIPGSVMSGYLNSPIKFPSWLGQNSSTNKSYRILQDLTVHTGLATSADKDAFNLDYAKLLINSITKFLASNCKDGIDKAVNLMNHYHLTKKDFDALLELTKWSHTLDPMRSVEKKTRADFTKECKNITLFTGMTNTKNASYEKKKIEYINEDEYESSDNDDENEKIENDTLIIRKIMKPKHKVPSGNKPRKSNSITNKPTSSKGPTKSTSASIKKVKTKNDDRQSKLTAYFKKSVHLE